MKEEIVRTLEDRILEAAARIRHLRSEGDRRKEECAALRARIAALETGDRGARSGSGGADDDLARVRTALRDAIRDLREEEGPAGDPVPGPDRGRGA